MLHIVLFAYCVVAHQIVCEENILYKRSRHYKRSKLHNLRLLWKFGIHEYNRHNNKSVPLQTSFPSHLPLAASMAVHLLRDTVTRWYPGLHSMEKTSFIFRELFRNL